MEAKLNRADIVILADSHNPSIVSPEWLCKKSLIKEKPKNFVNTPQFSMVESEVFMLVVDYQRWQLTAKKLGEQGLKSIADIARGYIDALREVPYKSIGLNFFWSIKAEDGSKTPSINIKLNGTEPSTVLSEYEVNYGCIIHAIKEPYVLKITIDPENEEEQVINFNFHYEVKSVKVEELCEIVSGVPSKFKESSSMINKLYSLGVD